MANATGLELVGPRPVTVIDDDDQPRTEPVTHGGEVGVVVPSAEVAAVAPEDQVEVVVPVAGTAPVLVVDDGGGQPATTATAPAARVELKLNLWGSHHNQGTPAELGGSGPSMTAFVPLPVGGGQVLLQETPEVQPPPTMSVGGKGSTILLDSTDKFGLRGSAPAAEVFAPGPVDQATDLDSAYENLTAGALP